MMEKVKAFLRGLNPRRIILGTIKIKLIAVVEEEGNRLQETVKRAVDEKGPAAIDAAFDGFQELLKARIQAL